LRKTEVLCTRCPRGCLLRVTVGNGDVTVEGNECPVGEKHGAEEALNPVRTVSTTVRILGARLPRLPVRTSQPVSKSRMMEVVAALRGTVVEAPVKAGQVILKNVAGTGVDIVAERDVEMA
jgi:CxxC motif-containing protein